MSSGSPFKGNGTFAPEVKPVFPEPEIAVFRCLPVSASPGKLLPKFGVVAILRAGEGRKHRGRRVPTRKQK